LKALNEGESDMYERILVAVDGSPGAARAVTHAIALSKSLGARLRILHVVDMGWLALGPELAVDTQRIAAARRAAGEKDLALALDQAHAAGVDAETALVETGAPGQRLAGQIVEQAQGWPAAPVSRRAGATRPTCVSATPSTTGP
jgi:nucleotide-binding universal stress UspA family protein